SSRVVRGKPRFGRIDRAVSIKLARFTENGDEHWRNILQEIFGLRLRRKIDRVLAQFVCHLINDESTTGSKSVMRLSQEIAFLFDLQNTKRNSRDNVIAVGDATLRQFRTNGRGVRVDHSHARVISELPGQIARKMRIKFKQK